MAQPFLVLSVIKYVCCLAVFCGIFLFMIETPQSRSDILHQNGVSFLNKAQDDDLHASYKSELLDAAITYFSASVSYRPQKTESWVFLGHSLQQAEKTLQAQKAYQVADRLRGVTHLGYISGRQPYPQTFAFMSLPE